MPRDAVDACNMRPSEIEQYVLGLEKAISEVTRLELENSALKRLHNGLRMHVGWQPLDFDHWGES